jgi:TrmH family RNA methyltransferase
MITSARNPSIKYIRRLLSNRRYRQDEQAFVVEGDRWLDELIKHAIKPEQILVTKTWLDSPGNHDRLKHLGKSWKTVADKVLDMVSDTETAPGVLAVVPIDPTPIPTRSSLLLILDRLGDPGNLGTVIRTALAANVDALLLSPGCVDPYNPKVVRASMGSLLHLPVVQMNWGEIAEVTAGKQIFLAAADAHQSYYEVDWNQPSALIIGSEAVGAGPEASGMGIGISIPMAPKSESLNAAIATGIILFEAVRQRREPG